jgi:hypothetical protein
MDVAGLNRLLERLPLLSVDELRSMRSTWNAADGEIREGAWRRGKPAIVTRDQKRAFEAAGEAVARWVRDYATGRSGTVVDLSWRDSDRLEARIEAAPAVLDAILALVVPGSLDHDERETLLGPWQAVAGEDWN